MSVTKPYAGRERRLARPSLPMLGLVVLGVAGITFATLCPIGLRPHLAIPANEERAGAYAALGMLVTLAAGRRWMAATAFVVILAFGLEAAQLLAPGRHAVLSDAMVKAFGGVFGATAGQLTFPIRRMAARALALAVRRKSTAAVGAP